MAEILNPSSFKNHRLAVSAAVTFFMLTGFSQVAMSQRKIQEAEQMWLGYFNQSRISKKSGIWVDLHYRLTDHYVREKTFVIMRVAYMYYLTNDLRLMAGYANAQRYNRGADRVPEHRPWQQLQWVAKNRWSTITHGLRVEQRYRRNVENEELTEGYNFNWRFRYSLALTVPLKGKQLLPAIPFLLLSNEVHLNAGKNILHTYFDQNRTFLGIGYQFTDQLSAHLGHLFIYQYQGIPDSFLHIHAIRLYLIHNLDFRKQEMVNE